VTVGSLFSGIGGLDLGFERAGFRVLWQCEADPWCRQILGGRWPGVPCHPDVRELSSTNAPRVDVLAGGFPCQDVSSAGVKRGLAGPRSGLWREFARLIGELRPRYVVVENVSALLSRGLGEVLGDLAACGFDAEWDCLPAAAVGAPQRRERVFVIAYPRGRGREGREKRHREGPAAIRWADHDRLVVAERRAGHAARLVRRVGDGIPAVLDRARRVRALGNAVHPAVAELVARRVIALEREVA
jgi:DNA (cytosine-5)-methyltransferase 1